MNDSSSSKQYWAVSTALIIIILAYVGYPGIENYSTTPKWIGLLMIGIIILYFQRKQTIKWSLGLTIWSIFIAQYLLQSGASYNTFDALAHSIPLVVGPLLVLGLFREDDTSNQLSQFSVLTALITLPLILFGFFELAELFSSSDYTRTSSYGIRFSFGHKNQLTHFFTLLVPIYAFGLFIVKKKWQQILLVSSIIAVYVFVTLLMNRTSLILLFGIYPLAAMIYFIHIRFSTFQKRMTYGAFCATAVLGILLIVSIPEQLPVIGDWMTSESGNERLMIWQNSLEIAKESPFLGYGSGDWKIEILRTSLSREGFENQVFFQRAHNVFIHALVENGIVGMLVLIAFFVFSFIQLIRASIDFRVKLMAITGLTGFFVIANFSFPLERVELNFLLFVFLVPTYASVKSTNAIVRYLPIGIAAICLVFAISWVRQERSFFNFRGDNGIDYTADLDIFTIDATSTPISFYVGNYYFERQNYQKAAASFETASRYNPYHVHVLNNLASSQSLIGEIEESKETYKRLFEIDSSFVEGLINAASVHYNSGEINQSLAYLLKIPKSKEPENFKLFSTTILRGALNGLKAKELENSDRIDRMNQLLESDDALLLLFEQLRLGKSLMEEIDNL